MSTDAEARLSEQLAEHEPIRFALLFGSRAHGCEHQSAPWEIGFFCGEGSDGTSRFKLLCRLAAELEELGRVEISCLDEASTLMAHRALQGRQLLMRDEVAYARFIHRTEQGAPDALRLASIHREARLKQLRADTFGRST